MGWRSVVGAGAAVSLVTAIGFACGDQTVLISDTQTDGGVDDATAADGYVAIIDAAADTTSSSDAQAADASEDAACGPDLRAASDTCYFGTVCANACNADALQVYCMDSGGGSRPPIDGCISFGPDGLDERWCCPRKCVPRKDESGGVCAVGTHLVACPMGLVPTNCSEHGGTNLGTMTTAYCCP